MDSFILEDVNELLKIKKGDSSRLIAIKGACESNEIISLSDRKYIERLTSQYLRVPEQKKVENQDKPKFVPIEEPETESKKSTDFGFNQSPQIEKPTVIKEQVFSENFEEKESLKIQNFITNNKIIFSIGSIALAIILIAVVAIGSGGIEFPENSGNVSGALSDFTLEIDKSSYETSDIISVSGKTSSTSKGTLRAFIENESNELIWAENLNLKTNGGFSTLLIAGGQGWEKSGKYVLNVESNEFSDEISFDFISR